MRTHFRLARIAWLIAASTIPALAQYGIVPAQVSPTTVGASVSVDFSVTPDSPQFLDWFYQGNLPPGLDLHTQSSTYHGLLSGVPTQAGTYTFTVQAYYGSSEMAHTTITMVVNPPPVYTASSPLPTATVGNTYSALLGLSGGTPPFSNTYAQNLPPGLAYQENSSGNGGLVGTPTQAGTFNFAVYATDAVGVATSGSFTLVVQPAVPTNIAILTTSLPNALQGSAYNGVIQANGQALFTLQGSLPPGITLTPNTTPNRNTLVAGTPTTPGTYNFTVTATSVCPAGTAGCTPTTASQSYRIIVYAPVRLTAACLSNTGLGQPYSRSFTATGGTGQYNFTASAESLPPGLTLSSSGTLSGTPTRAGTYSFTISVQDRGTSDFQLTAQQSYTLTVVDALNVSIGSAPEGEVGIAYAGPSIGISGGVAPYTYSVIQGGSLPPGLTIGANGQIAGTPTSPGTFNAQIRVSDSTPDACSTSGGGRSGVVSVSITIYPALSLNLPSLSNLLLNQSVSAKLTASGGKPGYTFTVAQGTLPAGLSLQGDTVVGTPTTVGSTSVVFRVTDALSVQANQSTTVVVQSPIRITTTSLPSATAGTSYLANFDATGGQGRLNWTIASGSLPAGLSLATTGILTGTPTTAGSSNFTVQVSDANNSTDSRAFSLQVFAALKITTSALAQATVRTAYEQPLDSTGGRTPLVWTAAGLPPGLRVDNSTASIVGAPTTNGRYSVTIGVTDANGATDARTLTLLVQANPADLGITTTALPNGQVGVKYVVSLAAQGGRSPYSWAGTGLPDGLALDSSGNISGTPTKAGSFTVSIQLSDAAGAKTSATLPLTITPAPLTITSSLGDGRVGTTFAGSATATGGTAPYTFAISAGSLPPGVTLSTGGVFGGTPTTGGTYTFTITVTDAQGQKASTDATVKIGSLVISGSVPNGVVGTAYSATLSATGGQGALSWSLESGALPDGLTLSGSGTISGTPTNPGAFSFRVAVSDATGARATQSFTITIAASIQVTPTAVSAITGTAVTQAFSATGGRAPYTFALTNGSLPDGLTLASNGSLSGTPATAGSFNVTVRATDSLQNSGTASVTLTVTDKLNLSLSLAAGTVGTDYSASASATGGRQPYRFSATGLPAGLSIDTTTGAVTGRPTTAGSSSVSVTVTDQSGQTATATADLTINLPSVSNPQVTGLVDRPGAQQQTPIGVTIGSVFPVDLSGTLTLTFTSDATLPGDDNAVRFTNGQRTLNFTIPAGSTTAVLTGGATSVQTGTTAGRITITGQIRSGNTVVGTFTREVRVDAGAPVITSVRATRTSTGFSVLINGYATSKQVTSARIQLTAASGQTLASTDFTVQVDSVFATYYRSASADNGSTFTLEIPFTVNPSTAVASVSATLTNSLGSSQAVSATLQ